MTRAAYARLSSVGFPSIVDRRGNPPQVIDPKEELPLHLNTEGMDQLLGNEIIIQFLALSRYDSFYSPPHPSFLPTFFPLSLELPRISPFAPPSLPGVPPGAPPRSPFAPPSLPGAPPGAPPRSSLLPFLPGVPLFSPIFPHRSPFPYLPPSTTSSLSFLSTFTLSPSIPFFLPLCLPSVRLSWICPIFPSSLPPFWFLSSFFSVFTVLTQVFNQFTEQSGLIARKKVKVERWCSSLSLCVTLSNKHFL